MDKINSPQCADVVALREKLQNQNNLGITAAQDLCASILHTTRRVWQHWERGERAMHPAFWELINIKIQKS